MDRVRSEAPYAGSWGYSRALRVGDRILVSGTSATEADGSVHAPNDPYAQTVFIIGLIERALSEVGAGLDDIVRTRAFLADIADWREVGRAHLEHFGETLPTSTCIGGAVLMQPELVVELEAEALLTSA
jgi:enamine deaminase RidA (YjgF/YER057c/UK114 family)